MKLTRWRVTVALSMAATAAFSLAVTSAFVQSNGGEVTATPHSVKITAAESSSESSTPTTFVLGSEALASHSESFTTSWSQRHPESNADSGLAHARVNLAQPALNRVWDCPEANDFFTIFNDGDNRVCFANAGTEYVGIWSVWGIRTGNNAGEFEYFSDGTYHLTQFDKNNNFVVPNGTTIMVDYIHIR